MNEFDRLRQEVLARPGAPERVEAHVARMNRVIRRVEASHVWRLSDEQHEIRNASQLVDDGGQWSCLFQNGLPVHGDGPTRQEAAQDAAVGLREYASDWQARLHAAPNHAAHRHVVEWIDAVTDEQLLEALLA